MSYYEREDRQLTREDFGTIAEWLQYLHESGLEPADEDRSNFVAGPDDDPMVQLFQCIHGAPRPSRWRPPPPLGVSTGERGVTRFLSEKKFIQAYRAVAFANCQGLVLNAFVSVTWSSAGIRDSEAVGKAQRRLLELIRKALLCRELPLAWVWVVENGRTRGLHSHILISVPRLYEHWFVQAVERAVETIARRRISRTKANRTVLIRHRRDEDVRAQWILLRYMYKGLCPQAALTDMQDRSVRVPWSVAGAMRLRAQGEVRKKRSGVSRGLDTAAIRAFEQLYGPLPKLAYYEGAMTRTEIFSRAFFDWHQQQELARGDGRLAALLDSLNI